VKIATIAKRLGARTDVELEAKAVELEIQAAALQPDRCPAKQDASEHVDSWLTAVTGQADQEAGILAIAHGYASSDQRWGVLLKWALHQGNFRAFLLDEIDKIPPELGGFQYATRQERDAERKKLEEEAAAVRVEIQRRAAESRRQEAEAELQALGDAP
jgi:hypothetical protein